MDKKQNSGEDYDRIKDIQRVSQACGGDDIADTDDDKHGSKDLFFHSLWWFYRLS